MSLLLKGHKEDTGKGEKWLATLLKWIRSLQEFFILFTKVRPFFLIIYRVKIGAKA
jgi:hypothetical protein